MATTIAPVSTSINIGEESATQPFTQIPPQPVHPGPPPHVHRFMKHKLRQGCCCLAFLILLNLIVVFYVAQKVTTLSEWVSSNNQVAFMPGSFKPFCSELCVSLCLEDNTNNFDHMERTPEENNDNMNEIGINAHMQRSAFACDLRPCLNSCSQYFETHKYNEGRRYHRRHDSDDSSDSSDNRDSSDGGDNDDSSDNSDSSDSSDGFHNKRLPQEMEGRH